LWIWSSGGGYGGFCGGLLVCGWRRFSPTTTTFTGGVVLSCSSGGGDWFHGLALRVFISPRHVCGIVVGAMVFHVLDLFHGLLCDGVPCLGFVPWVVVICGICSLDWICSMVLFDFFSLFIFTFFFLFFIVVVVFGIGGGDEVEVEVVVWW
jgi:hypothetical protein